MSLTKHLPLFALVASVSSFAIPQSAPAASVVPSVAAAASGAASVVAAAPAASGAVSGAASGAASAVPSAAAGPSTTPLVGSNGVIQPSASGSAQVISGSALIPDATVGGQSSTAPTTSLSKRPTTLLENSSTTIVVQVSSTTTGDPPINTAFCNANTGLTQQGWQDADLGGFLKEESQDFLNKGVGIQDAMKQLAGGIGNYACGFDQQCEITGALSSACDASPQPVGVLIGMANFNNFFRSINDRLNEVRDSVTNRLPDFANTFKPVEQFPPDPFLTNAQISLTLTVLGAYAGLLPGLAPAFATLFFVMGAATPIIGAQPGFVEQDPFFNNFADVSKAVGAVFDALSDGLRGFVQGRLDAVPDVTYRDSGSELPSILFQGDFASPTPNLGDIFQDDLFNVIGAFLINQQWFQAKTIVVKATQADFGAGANTNICEGDNIFPADVKFCDSDGNAYIIQTPPTEAAVQHAGLSSGALTDQTLFAVPGFASIGDFGLDVETITQSSVNTQAAHGYGGVPSNDEFANTISAITPDDASFKKAVIFNLPVCDFSKTTISSSNQLACTARFKGEDLDKCLFNMKIMCGCQSAPPLTTGANTAWPYDLASVGGADAYCNVF